MVIGKYWRRPCSRSLRRLSDTAFGYIDVDACQDHARAIGLTNVPACCYYRGRELMATVIGMRQDIAANLELIRVGKVPDMSNRMSNK